MRFRRTSDFGDWELIREHPHTGIDYAMSEGTVLNALVDGVVKVADYGDRITGKTVIIETDSGQRVIYGHLSDFLVKTGERVSVGEKIALSGNSGNSTGAHLHLALKDSSGTFIDPAPFEPLVQKMGIGGEGLIQSGADAAGDKAAEMAYLLFEPMMKSFGNKFLEVAPDALIVMAMLFCLGAIAGIGRCGKWAAVSVTASIVLEVIRQGVTGA